ncbi:hypothetical protein WH297_06485 [Ochrobactrum vermis]|uniref:Lipoprotein n=1 Tax=Ochrobactrum vermis TaxID=1827297 RepID=A0ABU8PAV0_9HYPH|nr:hypothetical protein [Ochrobactrum vermis]PQZ29862.1 hypothetical protein CQZ93_06625 [Ochrobactrum vermis]
MRGIIVVSALLAVAGCTKKEPCCQIKITPPTEMSKAFAHENWDIGYSKSDIKRCFGDGVINVNGSRIHIVEDTRKAGAGRYCHTAFSIPTVKNPNRYVMTPFSYENWDADACQLKAMYCLRPASAEKLAKRFGLTIDKTPVYRE